MQVDIHMETVIQDHEKTETMVQQYRGEWVKKKDSYYITYQEAASDTGKITTVIKVRPDQFTVIRRGAITMRQEYRAGEKTSGTYGGPFGNMLMDTETRDLHFQHDEANTGLSQQGSQDDALARLEWTYTLYLNEQYAGMFHTKMELKEVT